MVQVRTAEKKFAVFRKTVEKIKKFPLFLENNSVLGKTAEKMNSLFFCCFWKNS